MWDEKEFSWTVLKAIKKNNLEDKQRRKNEESLSLMLLCLFSICGDISIAV